jgi:hypothetical protein
MELSDVKIEYFNTDLFKLSFLNKRYKVLANLNGVIKNRNAITLFSDSEIEQYIDKYSKIMLINISEVEYEDFKVKRLKHTKSKEISTVLSFPQEYFLDLQGKENRQLRTRLRKFKQNYKVEYFSKPKAYLDFFDFIKEWEFLRRDAHHFLVTGYDKNFFSKFLFNTNNNLYPLFFYHETKMVGFSIIEHVRDNLFNYLFRKANTSINGLTHFVDFISFQNMSNIFKTEIIVNMGSDMGDKKLRYYKTHSFNVELRELITYKIKIINQEKFDETD